MAITHSSKSFEVIESPKQIHYIHIPESTESTIVDHWQKLWIYRRAAHSFACLESYNLLVRLLNDVIDGLGLFCII